MAEGKPCAMVTRMDQTLARLSGKTLVLTYILVILGAATRVWDAGMSCPDWPTCYGVLWPFPESLVPGGYVVDGRHYELFQVLLEWGHRLIAMLVGLLAFAIFVLSFKTDRKNTVLVSFLACVLLAIQVKLGAVTVWLENIHWSVALHLGNAMLFMAALMWFRRLVTRPRKVEIQVTPQVIQVSLWVFATLVWGTMLLGALISSSHSGGVCGGLPDCAGTWYPVDWQQMLHMQHRLMAVFVFVFSLGFVILCKKAAKHLHSSIKGAHLLAVGQICLGIFTLYSFQYYPYFYEYLSVLHLAMGTLLWMSAVGILLNVYLGTDGSFHAYRRKI